MNHSHPQNTPLLAALIHSDSYYGADALLAAFAEAQRRAGKRVAGLVQMPRPFPGGPMRLMDVRTRQEFPISQDLGSQSRSCCIDPGGVAQASAVLRQALHDHANLVVVNRFGTLEAEGGGFAPEILALASEAIPVLTVVAHKHLCAWNHFTGGSAQALEPIAPALHAWFDRAQDTHRSGSTT